MAAKKAARRLTPGGLRLGLLAFVILGAWGGLAYRLFEVQVVQAADLTEQGLDQRLTRRVLAPNRGTLFDRHGEPMAMTVEAQSIYAVPSLVENPVYTAQQIAAITQRDWEVMRNAIDRGGSFAYLARQLEPDVAQRVLDLGLPGVASLPEPKRVYPAGMIAAHVVGMVDVDGVGIEGLEVAYDDVLTGTRGEVVFERDTNGTPIPQAASEVVPAVPGEDLVSTVDLSLQYVAFDACNRTVERTSAKGCWIVALQPETGEILALVGSPGFDPERRTGPDGAPFANYAIRGMYEPGSTQKLITFAAALDTGRFGVSSVIGSVSDRYEVTPGACRSDSDDIYGCFSDFSPHETRDMTVGEIFTISSNIGTIKVQEGLAEGSLLDYVERFGYGSPTGVDYTGEAAGVVNRDPGCSSCLASTAIGYNVAVTPLQIAAAYATVANDGVWTQPYLVGSRVDVNGRVVPFEPAIHRAVSEETAWVMRQLLTNVVAEGTGTAAAVPGYTVGGKTGTANKLGPDGVYTEETMASFVGMAPIDDPKVVIAVVVDDPVYEFRTGGVAAAPVFSEVMEAALHALGVAPDAISG